MRSGSDITRDYGPVAFDSISVLHETASDLKIKGEPHRDSTMSET